MKIYMLISKTREIVKDAQKSGNKVYTYSKGLVVSQINPNGNKQFKTYSYWGNLKKTLRVDVMDFGSSTESRLKVENFKTKTLKQNTITRQAEGLKVLFENWTADYSKHVDKVKRYSAEYKTFEGEPKKRVQTNHQFRYL